jgi:hypothetical protein
MTNDELKELLARALLKVNGYEGFCEEEVIPKFYAQAEFIIEALAPMMREVIYELYAAIPVTEKISNNGVINAYASLPDCWREKGGV